eukprot:434725-Karenia_brevis.AAC.1
MDIRCCNPNTPPRPEDSGLPRSSQSSLLAPVSALFAACTVQLESAGNPPSAVLKRSRISPLPC